MPTIEEAIATVNRIYREFNRYTGDGLPGEPTNAPLPVGDPSSSVNQPKKSEIRAALIAVLVAGGQSTEEAEAAADRAEAAAAAAEDAVSSVSVTSFATRASAQAFDPDVAPSFVQLQGYAAPGDGGAALYKRVGSEPTHAGKLQIAEGSWYEIAEKVKRPAMFGGSLSALATALNDGDTVDGAGGTYAVTAQIAFTKNRLEFIGSATVNFNFLSLTGVFSFSGIAGPSFNGDWRFSGPETQASWDAKSTLERESLYCALNFVDCANVVLRGVVGSGVQVVVKGQNCPNMIIDDFTANGFLPNVPPIPPAGTYPPPYIDGLNWCDAIYLLACHDAQLTNLKANHYGNLVVMGGASLRPYVGNVSCSHMWDNVIYHSSCDFAVVENAYCNRTYGSVVKIRGSYARVRNISGDNVVGGVTLTPYDDGQSIPASGWKGEDCLVDGVMVRNAIYIAWADSRDFGGTTVALRNVTMRKLRGFGMLGTESGLWPIRAYIADQGLTIEDVDIESVNGPDVIVVEGVRATEALMPTGLSIRNIRVRDAQRLLNAANFKRFGVDLITFIANRLAGGSIAIRAANCFDGSIGRCAGDTDTLRIDCRTGCQRVSVVGNRMYGYNAAGVESFGNSLNEQKNVAVEAPFKVGQWAVGTSGNVLVSKGLGTADWVVV